MPSQTAVADFEFRTLAAEIDPPGETRGDPLLRLAKRAGSLAGSGVGFFRDADRSRRCDRVSDPLLRRLPGGFLEAVALEVVKGRAALVIRDLSREWRIGEDSDGVGLSGAVAAIPVADSVGRVQGVIGAVDPEPRAWAAEELDWIGDLALAAAALLDRDSLANEADELAAALEYSDTRYRTLAESCPLPVYELDAEGRLTDANEATARALGRPVAELIGLSLADLLVPEEVELAGKALREILSGRSVVAQVEVRVLRPTGERRVLEITRAPLYRDGRIVGVQGLGRDITSDRARESQFRRAERMASIAPLLSGVCHELNNPLTSIKSFAELLLLDDRPDDDREALEIVLRESHRAADIVAELRMVARQSQEASTGRGVIDVNAALLRVIEQRRPALEVAGIELNLSLDEALPPAWAVRTQIEQVATQLLTNAEYAVQQVPEDRRRLTVRTGLGDFGVSISVADTGVGIPEPDLDRIFDPFFTTRAPGEGTGLGLSIVHNVVTDHGGRIRVDSTEGSGTTLMIELPVADQPPVLESNETDTPAKQGLRILVVDDEAPIRCSLARYLERRGHTVEQAEQGAAALQRLEDEEAGVDFDIIVADLRMPGLSGERLLQRLRERGHPLADRLVFITGDADSPEAARFLSDAGAPVVRKPFELAEIAQIVEFQAGLLG